MFGIIMIPWHSLIRVDVPVFGVNILPSAFKVDRFSLIFFFYHLYCNSGWFSFPFCFTECSQKCGGDFLKHQMPCPNSDIPMPAFLAEIKSGCQGLNNFKGSFKYNRAISGGLNSSNWRTRLVHPLCFTVSHNPVRAGRLFNGASRLCLSSHKDKKYHLTISCLWCTLFKVVIIDHKYMIWSGPMNKSLMDVNKRRYKCLLVSSQDILSTQAT